MKRLLSTCFSVPIALMSIFLCNTAAGQADYWTPRGAPLTDEGRTKSLDMVEPRREIMEIPFTIDQPGSYYLTATMWGTAGQNGITITCGDVRLDLNGFSLIGVPGSSNGVEVTTFTQNIVIRNGVLRNWDLYGVAADMTVDSTFCDLKAYGNGASGIYVGDNANILSCTANDNGFGASPMGYTDGITARDYSSISDSKARGNKGSGFNVYKAVKVTGCTATDNHFKGIFGYHYGTIRDCLATRNYSDGIAAFSNCRVEGNNSCENGTVSSGDYGQYGYGAGISVVGESSRIQGNSSCKNDYGILVYNGGKHTLIICNSAAGNTVADYETSAEGDFVGFIYDTNWLTEGGQAGFTANNPWANFTF